MSAPILDLNGPDRWGRNAELTTLLAAQRSPRSLTRLFGDSLIGKTTVLEMLRDRCRVSADAGDQIFCGFVECLPEGGTTDPLARCLHSLIASHLSQTELFQDQLTAMFRRISENAKDLDKLRAFALDMLQGAGELPGLGGFYKAFAKGVGAASSFAGVGPGKLKVGDTHIPLEAFTTALTAIRAVYPDQTLVLILDNLSADAESLGHAEGQARTLDTLQAFLSSAYRRLKGVHLVFSWRPSRRSDAAWDAFRETFELAGGKSLQLGDLSDDERRVWLGSRFNWFRRLQPEQQESVVRLSRGSPAIIAAWEDADIDSGNVETLQSIASDVLSQQFAPLRTRALSSPYSELLFQLTQMRRILPVVELAQLAETPPQAVFELMETWVAGGILKRDEDGFRFDHETKKKAITDELRKALYKNGEGARARLFYYYLNNVGFSTASSPTASVLGDFAAEMGYPASVPVAVAKVASIAGLASLYIGALAMIKPEAIQADLRVADTLSWNLRFFLYHRLLQIRHLKDLAKSFERRVLVEGEIEGLKNPHNYALGLSAAVGAYGEVEDVPNMQNVLGVLRRLAKIARADEDVREAFGASLCNAMTLYVRLEQYADFERCSDELSVHFRVREYELPSIFFMQGQALLVKVRANQGDLNAARSVLGSLRDDLHRLSVSERSDLSLSRFHISPEDVLALGLKNGVYAEMCLGTSEKGLELCSELRIIATPASIEEEVEANYIRAMTFLAARFAQEDKFPSAVESMNLLLAYRDARPHRRDPDAALANGTRNLVATFGRKRYTQSVDHLVELLFNLGKEYPDDREIMREFVKGIKAACFLYELQGRADRIGRWIPILKSMKDFGMFEHPDLQ